jgi:hypothetical protein
MANTEKKVTRKETLEGIKAVIENMDYEQKAAHIEFIEKEIASTVRKAEKARERAAKQKSEGDELRAAIKAILTSEKQTADVITEIVQADFEDITKAKVVARLSQLVRTGEAEKEEVKVGSRRLMGYSIAE